MSRLAREFPDRWEQIETEYTEQACTHDWRTDWVDHLLDRCDWCHKTRIGKR